MINENDIDFYEVTCADAMRTMTYQYTKTELYYNA